MSQCGKALTADILSHHVQSLAVGAVNVLAGQAAWMTLVEGGPVSFQVAELTCTSSHVSPLWPGPPELRRYTVRVLATCMTLINRDGGLIGERHSGQVGRQPSESCACSALFKHHEQKRCSCGHQAGFRATASGVLEAFCQLSAHKLGQLVHAVFAVIRHHYAAIARSLLKASQCTRMKARPVPHVPFRTQLEVNEFPHASVTLSDA